VRQVESRRFQLSSGQFPLRQFVKQGGVRKIALSGQTDIKQPARIGRGGVINCKPLHCRTSLVYYSVRAGLEEKS